MVDIRPLNIRPATNNRRDTIEVSVSELLSEIKDRFESKPLVPLKSPFRPRPTPGPSPLFRPNATAKLKSILKSTSTVNVCSPNSACGSSWVVVHSNPSALKEGMSTMRRSVSFNDVDSYSPNSSSTQTEISPEPPGSRAPPNTPATPFVDSPWTPVERHGQLTNMPNEPLSIDSASFSKLKLAENAVRDESQSNASIRPRSVSTPIAPQISRSKSKLVFPKPSPRHSRYKPRTYTQGTRPITRANSANSAELIWKPGWAGNKNANADDNGKVVDLGDLHPRKLNSGTKRVMMKRDKSLPPPPVPEKNSIVFPKSPPTPTSRPSVSRSSTTISASSTIPDFDDEKSFNILDLVVKLKKKLARMSKRPRRVDNLSPDVNATEAGPIKKVDKAKRKVSFILPADKKEPHHPAFKRRSSPYPRNQIISDKEDEVYTGSEHQDAGSESLARYEGIKPLKRADDFL